MNVNDDLSIHTEIKSVTSLKETKNVADPQRHSTDFGESACGEPLAPQRLVMDFTPNDEDTEFVQKKCCAFWDFITSCPELEGFIVVPEPNISEMKSKTSDIELAPIQTHEHPETLKTAVSMIEFIEEKGLITRAFETKLPRSGCSVGSQDYFDEKSKTFRARDKEEVSKCKKISNTCGMKFTLEQKTKLSSGAIQNMCTELRNWDAEHPKSMDPPGHPPSLDES